MEWCGVVIGRREDLRDTCRVLETGGDLATVSGAGPGVEILDSMACNQGRPFRHTMKLLRAGRIRCG